MGMYSGRLTVILLITSAFLIGTLLLGFSASPQAGTTNGADLVYPVRAETIRVIDGDTVRARVHIWLDQHVTATIRIKGIDAPERKSGCAHEKQTAQKAADHLRRRLGGKSFTLHNIEYDKYGGRVLADIKISGQDLAYDLISSGVVRPYNGGHRDGWC